MPNTYTELAKQTLGAATGTVTFSSIPSGYTDLVLVANVVGIGNISAGAISIRFNSDTATNYSATYLMGNGSSATSGRASNDTRMIVASPTLNLGNNPFVNIVQIQNYSNTTTNKTVLSRSNIAATQVAAIVGLYRSTSAITSITYESYNSQTMSIGSTFSLYGIANADLGSAKATGGIITEDSQYWYHTFGASGAFVPKQSLTCDVLVVAGGGGGSNGYGGGAGAGGVVYFASQSLTVGSYNCTIGSGGPGTTVVNGAGTSGVNSQFASLTASVGGGGGGAFLANGIAGGSGSGGGWAGTTVATGGASTQTGTGATAFYGNAGGSSFSTALSATAASGGGGGSGAVGGTATSATGGNGGAGINTYSSWLSATGIGVSGFIAGGGGGVGTTTGGTAGSGGGGTGASGGSGAGTAGVINTGSGGGATNDNIARNGGSGLIIVRYAK
jgi:hypothetical protein